MKNILGIIMIIGGVLLGLYVGVYLCFFGGIMSLVEAVQLKPVPAAPIAWGVVRIVFAGLAGYVTAFILIFPGWALATSQRVSSYRHNLKNRW